MSPAINDPTTAVQALDQIEDLLLHLGRRRLETDEFHDKQGNLCLTVILPSWEDLLRLALDEICFYGANSLQVMRRMKALLRELCSLLPEERRAPVIEWQCRLQITVDRSFSAERDKLDASVEDQQGMGVSRARTENR